MYKQSSIFRRNSCKAFIFIYVSKKRNIINKKYIAMYADAFRPDIKMAIRR